MAALSPMHARRVRALFAVFACAALVCVMCLGAVRAHAEEAGATSEYTVGGVSYQVPSGWNTYALGSSALESAGLTEGMVHFTGNAVLFAGFSPSSSIPTSGDVEVAADEVNDALSQTPLAGMVEATYGSEGGMPYLSVATDDIVFNGETYLCSAVLYGVSAPEEGVLVTASIVPASGVVVEDLLASIPTLQEPARIEVSGISYEVPAGFQCATGSIFGVDVVLALSDEAVALGVAMAQEGLDDYVTVGDLQELVDSSAADLPAGTWMGAYEFCGYPTVGFEASSEVEGVSLGDLYAGATVSFTDEGLGLLVLLQPLTSDFAATLLGSAAA